VKNYPDAPATEEALFIMVKAYDALGLNDLRDDAERVMRKNFPEQRILCPRPRAQGAVVEALVGRAISPPSPASAALQTDCLIASTA
jgi:hypothetical protein